MATYYRDKIASGIDFGPSFRTVAALWGRDREALGEISLREGGERDTAGLSPLLLDGCFQVFSATRGFAGIGGDATYLPFGWERLSLYGPLPARLLCRARLRPPAQEQISRSGSTGCRGRN